MQAFCVMIFYLSISNMMSMKKILRHLSPTILLAGLAFGISPISAIAETTPWQDLGGGRARMVSVYNPDTGKVEGIVDVELKPGWTTYWRNPGEAGIPPLFDFSKSKGVAVSAPGFPVPRSKAASGIVSVVYTQNVAFPFEASPLIAPLSGEIKLEILLGVCEAICIPAVADFSQDLSKLNRSDPLSSSLIAVAKQKLPVSEPREGWPNILGANMQSDTTVLIKTNLPLDTKKAELFVEGKDTWFFNPAKLVRREGLLAEFELSLLDLPEGTKIGETPLRMTLTADGNGYEAMIVLGH